MDISNRCPICGAYPELYWSHTPTQAAGHAVHGHRVTLADKLHEDARPLYACPECRITTKPQENEALAARAWDVACERGKFQ